MSLLPQQCLALYPFLADCAQCFAESRLFYLEENIMFSVDGNAAHLSGKHRQYGPGLQRATNITLPGRTQGQGRDCTNFIDRAVIVALSANRNDILWHFQSIYS